MKTVPEAFQSMLSGRGVAGWDDRRAERRHWAQGWIVLRTEDPAAEPFRGDLIDVSASGFRARHANVILRSGELVGFESEGQWGLARVVWSRIAPEGNESGFLILSLDSL
jgi:hypothetical protein